jgi:small GTP-binding protein
MVGNSKVGKTCLVSSYLNGTPDLRTPPTVAPAFSSRQVRKRDGSIVLLEIWDTAGQEKYAPMSQLFFRNADIAMLCFDPKDPPSVTDLANWADRVLKEVPQCRLYGVMTKSDLYGKELESVFEDAKKTLEELELVRFFVTSAVTRDGVEALFGAAAELSTKLDADDHQEIDGGSRCC